MKKTIFLIILSVLLILPVAGCNAKNDNNDKKTSTSVENKVTNSRKLSDSWNGRLGRYSVQVPWDILKKGYTDKTIIYCNVKFFDYKTFNEIVLCNKPDCKHYDENCSACVKMDYPGVCPLIFGYKDKMYVVTGRDIYTMNEDGSEHKKIIELPEDLTNENYGGIKGFLIDNTLYLQTTKELEIKFDKNGDPLDGETGIAFVLFKINLKDNTYKKIYEYKYDNDIDQEWLGVFNNKAYYLNIECPPIGRGVAISRKKFEELENELDTKLISVDLKTGKETVEINSKSKYYYHLIMVDDFIYYQDRTKGEIIKYNPKTKKKKVLVKDIFEYINFLDIGIKNNKLFYEIDYDLLDDYTKEKNKDVMCYVDIDTGEVTEVEYSYDCSDTRNKLELIYKETPEYFIIPIKEVEIGKDDFEIRFGKIKKKDFWNKNYKVEEVDLK